jgi:hypothetical protein
MIDQTLLEAIKQVPLPKLLADCGIFPVKNCAEDHYHMYLATYRGEKNPSLSVFKKGRVWLFKDHTTGEYGTNLDLLVKFNICADWRDAAEYVAQNYLNVSISSNGLNTHRPSYVQMPKKSEKATGKPYIIHSVSSVIGTHAESYILSRGIPVSIATRYLSFVEYSYGGSAKTLYGIGWPTIKGGWAIRWPKDGLRKGLGKYFLEPAGISFWQKYPDHASKTCFVFEGIFDCLSLMAVNGEEQPGDMLVLNSVENASKAVEILSRYEIVESYLDNDEAGRSATDRLMSWMGGRIVDRSGIFAPFNDYNDYLIKRITI